MLHKTQKVLGSVMVSEKLSLPLRNVFVPHLPFSLYTLPVERFSLSSTLTLGNTFGLVGGIGGLRQWRRSTGPAVNCPIASVGQLKNRLAGSARLASSLSKHSRVVLQVKKVPLKRSASGKRSLPRRQSSVRRVRSPAVSSRRNTATIVVLRVPNHRRRQKKTTSSRRKGKASTWRSPLSSGKNVKRTASSRPSRATSKRGAKIGKSKALKKNGAGQKRKKLRGHQLQKMKYNKRVAAIAKLWRAQQKARLETEGRPSSSSRTFKS